MIFALIVPEFLITKSHLQASSGFDNSVLAIVTVVAVIVAAPQVLPVALLPEAVAAFGEPVVSNPTFHVWTVWLTLPKLIFYFLFNASNAIDNVINAITNTNIITIMLLFLLFITNPFYIIFDYIIL